jgi:hypothetical protein
MNSKRKRKKNKNKKQKNNGEFGKLKNNPLNLTLEGEEGNTVSSNEFYDVLHIFQ